MKFIAITDLHLSAKNPASRTDHWEDAIFRVLDQVARVAVANGAPGVIIAGDLFHSPRQPFQTITRFVQWALQLPGPVITIPGNHDLLNDSLSLLPRTPYGLLSQAGVILDVTQPLRVGDVVMAGVPYPPAMLLSSWQMVGQVLDEHFPVGRRIVLGHCFATNGPATDYFGEAVHGYADLVAATRADVIVLGHDHRDQGVVDVDGCKVIQLGAVERGSLAAEEVDRQPKLAIIHDTLHMEVVPIEVPPAATVFDLAAHAARKEERTQVEEFVAGLKVTLGESQGMDLESRVQGLDVPAQVKARLLSYLTAAEA